MQEAELAALAARRTEELPGSELTHPFGEDWEVWKVRGRVFMLQTEITGESIVILKAAPEDGKALREAHPDVTPGYHMNKKHWITVHPGDTIEPGLVEDLVTESYLLLVEGLPRRQRPVDPATFGRDR
ncbi:MmcQ/YjbR family DNA-binding protein [Arsenicicoccus bolidensis]|uniref:MmcQ/YjbR family DNA-binding protein n=1 Tax=Arsenicicoccus bolidensis TaxID=229480 RepID=UPI0028B1B104|nr:MmcQ/YjbR family DNA-binding protein [Arsenicicoccus bolidensis]